MIDKLLEVIFMLVCSVCNSIIEKVACLNPILCIKCYYDIYNLNHKEECIECKKIKRVVIRNESNQPVCGTCNSKKNIGKCDFCKRENIQVCMSKKHNVLWCSSCRIKEICIECGSFKKLNKDKICAECLKKKIDKREVCIVCKELKKVHKRNEEKLPLCCKCAKIGYIYPKEVCIKCGKLKRVNERSSDGYAICGNCYESPKNFCIECGEFSKIIKRSSGGSGVCIKCYKQPEKICSICGELKKIEKYIDGDLPICKKCDRKMRTKTDEVFRMINCLRGSLRRAFIMYSKYGKKYTSKKYGIDYYKIVEFLGPCPGDFDKYQIDHIFPLSAFDFDDPEQIKIAFAPENHQWLSKEENLIKNNKYDKLEFKKYLEKFKK